MHFIEDVVVIQLHLYTHLGEVLVILEHNKVRAGAIVYIGLVHILKVFLSLSQYVKYFSQGNVHALVFGIVDVSPDLRFGSIRSLCHFVFDPVQTGVMRNIFPSKVNKNKLLGVLVDSRLITGKESCPVGEFVHYNMEHRN